MEYTYEQIKPLIKNETLEGQSIKVSFQAEGQELPIDSIGVMKATKTEVLKDVGKKALKQSFFSVIIRSISGVIGSVIGGTAGSIARSTTSQVGYAATRNQTNSGNVVVQDTPENRQKAVVLAFQSVASYFEYNETTKKWSAKN